MGRAVKQGGGGLMATRPSSKQSNRVAILKSTQEEGGVAKNGDVDAMTRLLGGGEYRQRRCGCSEHSHTPIYEVRPRLRASAAL